MNTIRHTLLAAGLLLCITFSYGQQTETYPKNELELNSFKFGFSKDFEYTSAGMGLTYRRMINKHLALHATAYGNLISHEYNERQQNYLNGYLGAGATWFLKESRQGLYVSTTLQHRFLYDITSKGTVSTSLALSTAIGARINLNKNIYLNASMDLNYDFTRKNFDVAPNVGIGFRF